MTERKEGYEGFTLFLRAGEEDEEISALISTHFRCLDRALARKAKRPTVLRMDHWQTNGGRLDTVAALIYELVETVEMFNDGDSPEEQAQNLATGLIKWGEWLKAIQSSLLRVEEL